MIGKISKGTGFKGCVNYVLGKPDARLLTAEGVLTDSIQTITDCFQTQRMMKPNIRQPVGHISLSYAPEDAPRMTDETLVSLAKEYMQKMGIRDTQYIIARHNDQKHPHVHIVFNRVDNNGRTISDRNDCYRNIKVCKELKEKYGLYFGKGKDRVRTHRLKGNDRTKYEIYHAVKNSLGKSNSWKQFISELSKQGIKTEFKYRGRSNVIQGLAYPSPKTALRSRLRTLTGVSAISSWTDSLEKPTTNTNRVSEWRPTAANLQCSMRIPIVQVMM